MMLYEEEFNVLGSLSGFILNLNPQVLVIEYDYFGNPTFLKDLPLAYKEVKDNPTKHYGTTPILDWVIYQKPDGRLLCARKTKEQEVLDCFDDIRHQQYDTPMRVFMADLDDEEVEPNPNPYHLVSI